MVTSLLILARVFHLGSGMILVGVVAFRWLILLPAFAGEAEEVWQKFMPLFLRLHQMFIWSGVILVISGLALFWATSAGMSDTSLIESLNGDALRTVLFQTQFGFVSQWRIGFAAILGVLMWKLTGSHWQIRRKRSILEITAGLIAVALMVSFAWTGHAAATGGVDFWWRITADALHLFAASIWPAGLLPFALFLVRARRIGDVSRLHPILTVASRFSVMSFITVGVLILAGFINGYSLVGSFQALLTTSYGRVLGLKLSLLFSMLCIAAWNRYHLLPLLFVRGVAPDKKMINPLLQRLQTFVLAEFGLGFAIVIVVSFLGTTPPPH
jgi:putative copper resistance protein D